MNSGIPFIKIANRVQVNVNLKWKRVAGPAPSLRAVSYSLATEFSITDFT
jgi:hypothetical protein